jgi:hypothetical protein
LSVAASIATTSLLPVAVAYTRPSSGTASTPCTSAKAADAGLDAIGLRIEHDDRAVAQVRDVEAVVVRVDAGVIHPGRAATQRHVGHRDQRQVVGGTRAGACGADAERQARQDCESQGLLDAHRAFVRAAIV